jgi:RNase P/RNase MRP subunit POP5
MGGFEMAEQIKRRFKPSMREKKRYLVLLADIYTLRNALRDFEKREWKIIEEGRGKILLRLNLRQLNKFKEILLQKGISCTGISGTIKRAKQKFWNFKGKV